MDYIVRSPRLQIVSGDPLCNNRNRGRRTVAQTIRRMYSSRRRVRVLWRIIASWME